MKRLLLTPFLLQSLLTFAQQTTDTIPAAVLERFSPTVAPKSSIFPGSEKQALEIIDKVLAQYEKNSPKNLKSYRYTAYEKYTVDTDGAPVANPQLKDFLSKSKILLWERSIRTDYEKGRGTQRIILADSLAGSAANLPETLFFLENPEQLPSFLTREKRPVLDFYLKESPAANTNDPLLIYFKKKNNRDGQPDGILEIDPQAYALKSVITYGKNRESFTKRIWEEREGHWFMKEMAIHRKLGNLEKAQLSRLDDQFSKSAELFLNGVVRYQNIEVNPDLLATRFSGYYFQRDGRFNQDLVTLRPEPLTELEKQTAQTLLPIFRQYRLDDKLEGLAALWRLNVRTGMVDWDLLKTVNYNQVEHLRFGLGARLNERFNPYFSPGAYAGYGIYDKRWKYGADVLFNFTPRDRVNTLRLAFQDDTFSAGRFNDNLWDGFMKLMNNGVDLNNNKIVYQKGGLVSFESDFARGWTGRLTASRHQEEMATPYDFRGLGKSFVNTAVGLSLKYSPNSEYVQTPRGRFVITKSYPEVFLNVQQGFKGLGGDFSFTKADVLFTHIFKNPLGQTGVRIWGGAVFGEAPIWHLYSMNGLSAGDDGLNFNFLSYLGFATMRGGYFYADKFVGSYVEHTLPWHFKSLGQQTSSIALLHRGEIGNMKNLSDHRGEFGTIDHYYQEVGLQWNNFLSTWFNLAVFYKVGYYAAPEWKNNLGVQLKFRLFGF